MLRRVGLRTPRIWLMKMPEIGLMPGADKVAVETTPVAEGNAFGQPTACAGRVQRWRKASPRGPTSGQRPMKGYGRGGTSPLQ